MKVDTPIPLEEIKAAQKRISDEIIRTPLVPLIGDKLPANIYLKLENLQSVRSFKIRAASNTIKLTDPKQLKKGVWTISSGNFAQALARFARKLEVKCTILVPEGISPAKKAAIKRLGAQTIPLPVIGGLSALSTGKYEGMDGMFIHPFSDSHIMAGNGTIGLEILEDLPDLNTIVIPWGGGGLACGIASAIRTLKPDVKIYAAEIETCTPLATAFKIGTIPSQIPYRPSFVEGIGYPFIFPEMWKLAQDLLDGALVVGLEETMQTIRLLAERNSIIAEGAGAVSVAAALSGQAGTGTISCIVSGGNIDASTLTQIFQGKIPKIK
jgi:threonine dehydratase